MTTNDFSVSWQIDGDQSDSPEAAAHEALRTLHETFAGIADDPNVFVVTDHVADKIHTIDLGEPDSSRNHVVAIWPRPQGQRFESRLNATDAKYLLDDAGFLTLRVRIDQETYLSGYAMFLSGSGGDDHFDALHNEALSFGVPTDCDATIVSVDGDDFLVDYRTDLSEFFDHED